jgi:hypothetical protein
MRLAKAGRALRQRMSIPVELNGRSLICSKWSLAERRDFFIDY